MPLNATRLVWALFAAVLAAAFAGVGSDPFGFGPFVIDRLTLFLAAAVTLVSGVVHTFSLRYMDGDARIGAFYARLGGLTLVVLALLAADHMVMFIIAWTAMGPLLAGLIGHVRHWPQARAAGALARRWFLAGSAATAGGMALLSEATGAMSISAANAAVGTADPMLLALACAAFALGAAIQCGLVPFHRWLMSSMTAPTPVSAFMHAGLVNAGGILLARVAPVLEAVPGALPAIFALGAASALLGALAALVQSDVKRGLASSTVAQMGFMVLQCGLGFFAAAIAHLVMHGLYKACLFLGAGSALAAARRPGEETGGPGAVTIAAAALAALAAGGAFAAVTGKLAGGLDTGAVLVVFAGIAAAHAVLAGGRGGSPALVLAVGPAVMGAAGAVYGAIVVAAELALAGVPGLTSPGPLGWVHIAVIVIFVGAWIAILAGAHRNVGWLYARMLAASQPSPTTITDRREAYHAG